MGDLRPHVPLDYTISVLFAALFCSAIIDASIVHETSAVRNIDIDLRQMRYSAISYISIVQFHSNVVGTIPSVLSISILSRLSQSCSILFRLETNN